MATHIKSAGINPPEVLRRTAQPTEIQVIAGKTGKVGPITALIVLATRDVNRRLVER
jgi:hypothetical protein